MSLSSPTPRTRLVVGLALVDTLFVLLNLLAPISVYSLDEESNLPTWYSSAKLLALAALALLAYRTESRDSDERPSYAYPKLWWPFAAFFLMLSIDETATLHERAARWFMQLPAGSTLRTRFLAGDSLKDSFIWPVLFAPFILAVLAFLVQFFLSRFRACRPALWLALGGCSAYVLAIVLEGWVAYSSPSMQAWEAGEISRYVRFTVAEEAAELYGTTLLLGSLLTFADFVDAQQPTDSAP